MADGSIIIDTRIRTDDVKKDTENLKQQMEKLADSASASAKKIDKSFDGLTIDDAAEGLGESFENEARQIEPIPEEIEQDFDRIDLEDAADGLADGFEQEADEINDIPDQIEDAFEDIDLDDAAEGLAESFDEAWDDVKKDTDRGAEHVKDKLDDIGDEAEEAGEKIESSLGDKLKEAFSGLSEILGDGFAGGLLGGIVSGLASGALDLLENAGKALIDLGKQAVAASAEIQAANAQFEQTFQGVEDSARAALQAIADETGISATRMQSSYTKIFAFLRTLGTDTAKALDISGRAMLVAADQAAYYDKTVEEVTESLQSFLKGNYENDAALGIAATETTRNAKANEMYAKSFQKLSESQKVDVLLAMVEAGNEASGALGQAARESDAWTNVTAELSEAWRQFLGVLGTPIIAALTPVVQGLTWALNGLGTILGYAFNPTPVAELALELAGLNDTAEAVMINGYGVAVTMQDIQNATESTEVAVEQLRLEYDEAREAARTSVDSQVGLLTELATTSDKSAKDIVANWEKQKEALNRYTENMQRAVQLGLDEALVQQLSDGSEQSMVILDELVNSTDVNIREINEAFRGVEDAKDTVSSAMAAIQTDMSDKLSSLAGDVNAQWGEMAGTVGASISEMQDYINSLQGKDVYVNVITKTVTSSGGGAIRSGTTGSTATPYSTSTASIPYLASGAVIPPNAPFAAVLGDQRNGTNLEAPEGLIRDIFREEMSDLLGSNLAGFEAVVAELQATREAIEDIQIGDTTIGRAAARYDRRQNLIRGGSTG